jgi:hemoglobin
MAQSLYDKYGGLPTVQAVVHKFYERINDERSLDRFFANIEMEKLMAHQVKFFSKILGGPDTYEGRSLKPAHLHLDIDAGSFATVGRLLQETLEDCGVAASDVDAIMKIVVSVKDEVISSSKAA